MGLRDSVVTTPEPLGIQWTQWTREPLPTHGPQEPMGLWEPVCLEPMGPGLRAQGSGDPFGGDIVRGSGLFFSGSGILFTGFWFTLEGGPPPRVSISEFSSVSGSRLASSTSCDYTWLLCVPKAGSPLRLPQNPCKWVRRQRLPTECKDFRMLARAYR